MKTNLVSLSLLGLGGLLAFSPRPCHGGEERGPYYSADVGGTIAESTKLKEFPGATPGSKLQFDPGVRLSVGGGYRFNDWLSVGGETGFMVNTIKGADAAVSQVPMFANVEFRLPCTNKWKIVPFIGGGPGVSFSTISLDHESLGNGTSVDGSSSDAVFAWQAYGGVRYKINDAMSVGVVYKYFEADAPRWEVDNTSQDIRFGRAHIHTISASFSMSF